MENNLFNVPVSLYRSVKDRAGVTTSLHTFLFSTRHKEEILAIRQQNDHAVQNEMKKKLPLCTPSGVFAPTRGKDNLQRHSGFICIDIDAADNPQLYDISQIRRILENRPEVAFAEPSVSGKGYFAIIPIKFPHLHKAHFDALLSDYKEMGVNIDIHCSDVSRLRGISYDEHPYINWHPKIYTTLMNPEMDAMARFHAAQKRYSSHIPNTDRTVACVEHCVREIIFRQLDMTASYDTWIQLGSSLAALGEQGRIFFHDISQFYPQYNKNKTDRKFDSLLKRTDNNIGTFFNICRDFGITYKNSSYGEYHS